jgi:ketosteroid isomerase-like protein
VHPNEQVLRGALDAITRGDQAALASFIADDAVTHFPGTSRLAGDHHGRGALGARIREITGQPLQIEVHDVLASDDHAVGAYLMTAERDGRRLEWRHVNLYHMRSGKIVEVWQHPFDLPAVDEFFA